MKVGNEWSCISWIQITSAQGKTSPPSKDSLTDTVTGAAYQYKKGTPYTTNLGKAENILSFKRGMVSVYYEDGGVIPVGDIIRTDFLHSNNALANFSSQTTPSELPDLNPWATCTIDITGRAHCGTPPPINLAGASTPKCIEDDETHSTPLGHGKECPGTPGEDYTFPSETTINQASNNNDGDTSSGGEETASTDGSQDCDTCTSTSECSTCSSDGGESTSTDGSSDCASCTSTSECSACDTTDTSTSTSDSTNTDTTSTSTSTPTAPGLYPVGASLATVNGQQMPSLAPGDSHTAKLITKSGGYAIVHWYLLPPGDSRTYGDELFPTTYAQGSTIGTEVTFSFTFPSGARGGVYKLTAYIYPHSSASDQTCYEYIYYIYVS